MYIYIYKFSLCHTNLSRIVRDLLRLHCFSIKNFIISIWITLEIKFEIQLLTKYKFGNMLKFLFGKSELYINSYDHK